MASRWQGGCSCGRIKHYKQPTRAPFDKIARLWSAQFLMEDGFRAHQRKAGLEVVYHASQMSNQCFTRTESNNILKVKAFSYLRWLCGQREGPQSSQIMAFPTAAVTQWISKILGWVIYAVFIFVMFFHSMNKTCFRKTKKKGRIGGTRSEERFHSVLCPSFVVCVLVFSHIAHMQV